MGNKIKNFSIISGAPESDIDYIKSNIDLSSYIISADSGYVKCAALNITPNLIIGDFDSMKKPQTDIETITLSPIKDETDTFFAIKEAIQRGARNITIYNAIGNRFDHSYSNVLCLDYCKKLGVNTKIISKNSTLLLIENNYTINKNNDYKYFSLFAYLNDVNGLSISGSKYNLDNYNLNMYDLLCQSNEVIDNYVNIEIKDGTILLVLSND